MPPLRQTVDWHSSCKGILTNSRPFLFILLYWGLNPGPFTHFESILLLSHFPKAAILFGATFILVMDLSQSIMVLLPSCSATMINSQYFSCPALFQGLFLFWMILTPRWRVLYSSSYMAFCPLLHSSMSFFLSLPIWHPPPTFTPQFYHSVTSSSSPESDQNSFTLKTFLVTCECSWWTEMSIWGL